MVEGLAIRRTVRAGAIGAEPGWLEARFVPAAARVQLSFAPALGAASGAVIAATRRWLDLDAAPEAIDAALAGLPGAPGLRLPGSVDAFELAVRAVLGQQVTVAAARTLAARLVARFGADLATPWPEVCRTFPAPDALPHAPIPSIAELGIIRGRAEAIVALGRDWAELAPLRRRRRDAGAPRRAPVPDPRHRAVDGALRRDARARLARCLPAGRRRRPEGDAAAVRDGVAARSRPACPGLAALALVRPASPLEFTVKETS